MFDRFQSWLVRHRPYFFTYSEGFFNLSFLANSPKMIVESCKNYPFSTFDEHNQIVQTDNAFMIGELLFCELELGLWFLNSRIRYKNNISYQPIYDKKITSNYYCLIINQVQNHAQDDFYKIDDLEISNYSISILKPNKYFLNTHFKGAYENQYLIYFDEKWLENNIKYIPNLNQSFLDFFENSTIDFYNCKIDKDTYKYFIDSFYTVFNSKEKINRFVLKQLTYDFFDFFSNHFKKEVLLDDFLLKKKDKLKMNEIEKYLIKNIYEKFVGIEYLSAKYSISATKLKNDFKLMYGMSIYTYFQTKQMELAKQILLKQDLKFKEVSGMFKYENASKFSKSFYKIHQKLPSEILN